VQQKAWKTWGRTVRPESAELKAGLGIGKIQKPKEGNKSFGQEKEVLQKGGDACQKKSPLGEGRQSRLCRARKEQP